jgi:Fe-S oxidoreductase
MWSETEIGGSIEVLRVQQLAETEAEIFATACPFCKIMLDDGLKLAGLDKQTSVLDVAEILDGALGNLRPADPTPPRH